jgi:opacity protein-like surface antigen
MKKILLFTAFVIAGFASKAQFAAGDLLLGGSVGFTSQKTESTPDDFKRSTYSFNPMVFYQIDPKFSIGLNFGIAGSKEKPSDEKTTDLQFGPMFRYQGKWIEDKVSCYGQLNINIGSGSEESTFTNPVTGAESTSKDKYSSFGVQLFPGINYKLKEHFYLDFRYGMLDFTSRTNKPDGGEDFKTNNFEFNLGLETLQLGALYKF